MNSFTETTLFKTIGKWGLVGLLTCFALALFAPLFLPWLLKDCETSMEKWDGNGKKNYTKEEYDKELRNRKFATTVGVFVIWLIAVGFFVLAQKAGYP